MCFINKLDRTGANFFMCVDMIPDRLGSYPLVLQLPIGIESDLKGVVDLVANKAIVWQDESLGAKFDIVEIPEDLKDQAKEYREKLIEKVWEWKNQYGDIIINQLKKLGCSCDWSRNAFTMDKNLSKSVVKVFVELHKKKLIYKAEKLVNWDTVLKTAISDLEVDQREMNSKIYYIRYPIDKSSDFITIATTRPETMLGDTAIAVNPKDKRFKKYVGKTVTIPIVGRKIKIIKDNYADPEQGTGALKITPAHDFNDYDVGQRNKLEIINVFTEDGKINNNAPSDYVGLDRFEARKKILNELKEKDFFVKEENIKNKVPYGDRSKFSY